MSVLFVVVPAAMAVVITAILAYLWAARRGQFDDLETPAMRVLHDDEPPRRDPRVPPGDGKPDDPEAPESPPMP